MSLQSILEVNIKDKNKSKFQYFHGTLIQNDIDVVAGQGCQH